jgi:PAS domain-containing protein
MKAPSDSDNGNDELYRLREALRQEQERFATIAAAAPGVILSFRLRPDGSSCFPYASPAIADIYGVQPQQLMHDAIPATRLIHPDDLDRLNRQLVISARTLAPLSGEWRVCHPYMG